MIWRSILLCGVVILGAGASEAGQRHLEVYYQPEHRLTGDPAERKDHAVALHLIVPTAPAGPRPCIVLVHGGGWGGGDIGEAEKIRGGRTYGHGHDLIAAGLARGFVMVNFNYHLSPKGIFPAVYDDFRDALRFLRKNAATYHIDPTRIGAAGFSAGGWLLGTACWTNGEYLMTAESIKNPAPLADFVAGKVRKVDPGVYLSLGHERSDYPEQYGLCQAVSYDFQANLDRVLELKEFPAINQWCGQGVKIDPAYAQAGILFSHSVLADEKYRGKGVHVPGMDKPALDRQGKPVTLAGAVLDFFHESLVERCRTPLPELRPGLQVFAERCELSFITPDPAIAVHYTLDGSMPTTASLRYAKPFTITGDTTVRALAAMPGREPSLVTTGRFWKRPDLVPPRIVAPAGHDLPPGEAGKPYRVAFVSDPPGAAHWEAHGELRTYEPKAAPGTTVSPTGLILDAKTGVLSGTPKHGGTYWVQVQVAVAPGRIGSLRNYRLRIAGAPGAGATTVGEDDHLDLCRCHGWSAAQVTALRDVLMAAKVDAQIQADGSTHLVVVPAAQQAAARAAITTAIKAGTLAAVQWSE